MFKVIMSASLVAAFLMAVSLPTFATDPDVTSREAWRTLATSLTNSSKNLSVSNVTAAGSSTVTGASTAGSYSTAGAITGNSLVISNSATIASRAPLLSHSTTNYVFEFGQGTNGQVVSYTTPFTGAPRVLLSYAQDPGASTNVNVSLYPTSVNPTNFTITGVPAKLVNWSAVGVK